MLQMLVMLQKSRTLKREELYLFLQEDECPRSLNMCEFLSV